MELTLTSHARYRAKHRAIPGKVMSRIYQYGAERYSAGAVSLFLDKEALALAEQDLTGSEARTLARYQGVYLIIGDMQQVITVARSSRRFRR